MTRWCMSLRSSSWRFIVELIYIKHYNNRFHFLRMSEPPLKKKRTILDFFKKPEIQKRTSPRKANNKAMATAPAAAGFKEPKTVVNKNEETQGSSKARDSTSGSSKSGDFTSEGSEVDDQSDTPEVAGKGLATSEDIPNKKPSQIKAGSVAWKGIPLKQLDKLNGDNGPLINTDKHKVLFQLPFTYDGKKAPYPWPKYQDKWDAFHVRLPCSSQNEYPATNTKGHPYVRKRWEMIEEELLADIPGPYELEEKILSYNNRYQGKWNFEVLNVFFIQGLEQEERTHFFTKTIKKIATLALQLPHICTTPIPLLRAGKTMSITLSQQQIACLLANAFFCTFPRRNAKTKNSEYIRYPTINFNTLYMGQPTQVKFEKLKCIIHYFRRVCDKMPTGTVTFTRQVNDRLPDWDNDDTTLKALHVSSEGTIEDDGEGFLQADFANMYLGGGVLGHGCVQEEIRFLICPEMIASRLFTECLQPNECLLMYGSERFSNYEGYASSFEWKEDYVDKTKRDSWGRIMCEVVAIDALVIGGNKKEQFKHSLVKRELNKAYCGFKSNEKTDKLPAVCTGNWGCGAFGGDKQLKALIQLIAAAKAGRDMCYFTFDDERIRDELHSVHKYLTEDNMLSIGVVMHLIFKYNQDWFNLTTASSEPDVNLIEYIISLKDKDLKNLPVIPLPVTARHSDNTSYYNTGSNTSQSHQSHRSNTHHGYPHGHTQYPHPQPQHGHTATGGTSHGRGRSQSSTQRGSGQKGAGHKGNSGRGNSFYNGTGGDGRFDASKGSDSID